MHTGRTSQCLVVISTDEQCIYHCLLLCIIKHDESNASNKYQICPFVTILAPPLGTKKSKKLRSITTHFQLEHSGSCAQQTKYLGPPIPTPVTSLCSVPGVCRLRDIAVQSLDREEVPVTGNLRKKARQEALSWLEVTAREELQIGCVLDVDQINQRYDQHNVSNAMKRTIVSKDRASL